VLQEATSRQMFVVGRSWRQREQCVCKRRGAATGIYQRDAGYSGIQRKDVEGINGVRRREISR